MVAILLIDIILLAAFGVPVYLACRKWTEWTSRLSDMVQPFEKPRRFGRRSWAARSFVLDAPADKIRQDLNALTEMEWTSAPSEPSRQSKAGDDISTGLMAVAPLFGSRTVPTGVEIEWLDDETAELHARQHADWPSIPEDEVRLPFKQRQRLAERVMLHIVPLPDGRTRISYELRTPDWVYVMGGTAFLAALWISWGLWELQSVRLFAELTRQYGLKPEWLLWNTATFWILAAWMVTYIARLIRLQNISLLDGVISTFGQTSS